MKALAIASAALLWLAAACSAPAQPSGKAGAEPVGTRGSSEYYVADVRDAPAEAGLSSSIELRPDGTFDWRLNVYGLALSARGEWQRDVGMIRLSNPDQVGDPVVELVASSRDPADAVRVSLEPATARMASVLEAELEFPDSVFARVPLDGGEFSIPADGGQRPIAVRLMSEPYSFRSQPFEIPPDGDNVLTLRMIPADLGQAFFSSQQMGWDDDGGTLDWRGIALRYNRAEARPDGETGR